MFPTRKTNAECVPRGGTGQWSGRRSTSDRAVGENLTPNVSAQVDANWSCVCGQFNCISKGNDVVVDRTVCFSVDSVATFLNTGAVQ